MKRNWKAALLMIIPALINSCSGEEKKQQPIVQNDTVQNGLPPAPAVPLVRGVDVKTMTGKWKLDGMINLKKGDTIKKEVHYHFKDDCTFSINKENTVITGSWKISDNNDTLTLIPDKGNKEMFTGIVITGDNGIMNSGSRKFLISREK